MSQRCSCATLPQTRTLVLQHTASTLSPRAFHSHDGSRAEEAREEARVRRLDGVHHRRRVEALVQHAPRSPAAAPLLPLRPPPVLRGPPTVSYKSDFTRPHAARSATNSMGKGSASRGEEERGGDLERPRGAAGARAGTGATSPPSASAPCGRASPRAEKRSRTSDDTRAWGRSGSHRFFGRDRSSGSAAAPGARRGARPAAPRRSLSRGDRTCMRCASKGPQMPSRTAAEKRELWAKRGLRGPYAARRRERYRRALEAGAPEHKKQKEPSRVEQRDRQPRTDEPEERREVSAEPGPPA